VGDWLDTNGRNFVADVPPLFASDLFNPMTGENIAVVFHDFDPLTSTAIIGTYGGYQFVKWGGWAILVGAYAVVTAPVQ
jgi:hypothetical protein